MARLACEARHPDRPWILCGRSGTPPRDNHPHHTGYESDRYIDWANDDYQPSVRQVATLKSEENKSLMKRVSAKLKQGTNL